MAPSPRDVVRFIGRNGKRVEVSLVGGVLVLGGLAMLVLPGPGILVVVLGFAILGTEYAWAASALERTKRVAAQAGGMARGGVTRAARAAQGKGRAAGRRIFRR